VSDVIELDQVGRTFRSDEGLITALAEVTLSISAATFVAVMGATGSGKSTLLHCAAGLDRPSTGMVRLCNEDLGRMSERAMALVRRERVGFVFQSYNLLSELTVEQNVLLPHRLGAPLAMPVADALGHVGLVGTEHRPVGALSGGQRQRVAGRERSSRPRRLYSRTSRPARSTRRPGIASSGCCVPLSTTVGSPL
jgi:putative ABC transport system ATP-binding protein